MTSQPSRYAPPECVDSGERVRAGPLRREHSPARPQHRPHEAETEFPHEVDLREPDLRHREPKEHRLEQHGDEEHRQQHRERGLQSNPFDRANHIAPRPLDGRGASIRQLEEGNERDDPDPLEEPSHAQQEHGSDCTTRS